MSIFVRPSPRPYPLATPSRRRENAIVIFNPQIDLCHPKGKKSIFGANEKMLQLANFIKENVNKIDEIFICIDYNRPSAGDFLLKGTVGAAIVPTIELAVQEHFSKTNNEPFILTRERMSWNERASETKACSVFENALKRFRKILISGQTLTLEIVDFLEFWNDNYGLDNVIVLKDVCSSLSMFEHNLERLEKLSHFGLKLINSEEIF